MSTAVASPMHRRRPGATVRLAAVALLAAMACVGVAALSDEISVFRARSVSEAQEGELPGWTLPDWPAADAGRVPARAAASRAVVLARAAAALPPGRERDVTVAAARSYVARALLTRPDWGEAWVTKAYVELVGGSKDSPAALAALARSYAAAPYLRDGAPWRIRYAVDRWRTLDPSTRARVVDEAAWLAGVSKQTYGLAMDLVIGTPAYPLVQARRAGPAGSAALSIR